MAELGLQEPKIRNPVTGGLEDNPNYIPPGSISSDILSPQTEIPYVTPSPTPVPNVAGLDSYTPPLQLTQPEKEAQSLTDSLRQLNEQLVGQSAFKTEQEEAQGLPGLLQQHQDLSARLKALQNEALAIPLQLQQESIGRGITAAGLRPLETAALRTNAIQALSTASLLEASRGNILLAQTLVDRAVSAKYDPIREQINAKLTNLDLILKSPAFTVAEKNRAQRQLDEQNRAKKMMETAKENSTLIYSWANAALANGAPASEVRKLIDYARTDFPDLGYAFQLYAPYAKNPDAIKKALLDFEAQRADIEYKKSQTAANWANVHKLKSPTPDVPTVKTINGVDVQYDPATKSWIPVPIAGGGANATPEKTQQQLSFLQNTIDQAQSFADAAGRSGLLREAQKWFYGSTDYTKLESLTNTLRVNVLTLMADPSIRKFFGPQMSNADVTLMTSAATTLNPELNDPIQMKTELTRLSDLLTRMQNAVRSGESTGGSAYPAGTDGAVYGLPGYVSDGTQWVLNE